MSVTVFLANQGFTLPATNLDDTRREAYFKNPRDAKNQLKPEEEKILLALGINKENAACITPFLARFFKQLPKCQSDANLTLARDCEVVQHVLWETLFAARARSEKAYKDNFKNRKPLADISAAINSQIIDDLKPKPESINDIDLLFTLILKEEIPVDSSPVVPAVVEEAETPTAPPSKTIGVDDVFTLIVPAKMDENPTVFVPSPPGSQTGPIDASSAITAPSVDSTSTKSSFLSRLTKKGDKKSPFTSGSTQLSNGNTETETETEPGLEPNGKSPFTEKDSQIPLSNEILPPLSVIPSDEELFNQCKDKERPTARESHMEEFKRSLYFFHSIQNQTDIDLSKPALEPQVEKKFISDWQKAIHGKRDKTESALKFLHVPRERLSALNTKYKNFINGGERPSPISAYECGKIGETAAGYLERFYPTIERTEKERLYLFQHADWPAGTGSDISLETPKSVDTVSVSIRDQFRNDDFKKEGLHHLTIITTEDIDYSENGEFDYNIQGAHITDYQLMRDLFPKNKNYILNISPQLIYLFYQERNIPRPTSTNEEPITINDAFFKNAFAGNHIPPQLSLDTDVQQQIDMAYYALCNAVTIREEKPYKFYSLPTSTKLPKLIDWLENSSDEQYKTIKNLMAWAVSSKAPLEKSVLLDLFKTVAKKPESYFSKMFTRKNKKNKNNAKTLKNSKNQERQNTTNQQPVNALTAARRAAVIPPQSMLEISGTRKRNTKGMNNATRKILAQAQPRPGSVAEQLGLPPSRPYQLGAPIPAPKQTLVPRPGSVAAQADPASEFIEKSKRDLRELQQAPPPPNVNEPPLVLQEPPAAQPKRGLFDLFKRQPKQSTPQEPPPNIDPYYLQDNVIPTPAIPNVYTGTSTVPGAKGLPGRTTEEQALINARLNARNAATRRAAASRGRNKLRKGLKTRRLNNIRRRAQNLQRQETRQEEPVDVPVSTAQREKNIAEAKQRILQRQSSDSSWKSKWAKMTNRRKNKFIEQLADRIEERRMLASAEADLAEARRQNNAIAQMSRGPEPTAEELAELEAL